MSKLGESYTFWDNARKRWVARYSPLDPETGKRRNFQRYCITKAEAVKAGRALVLEWEQRTPHLTIDPAKLSFEQFALEYQEKKLIAREFVREKKIAGLSDPGSSRGWLKQLRYFFRGKKLIEIKLSHLHEFKRWLAKVPAHSLFQEQLDGSLKLIRNESGGARSLNSLHRPLELARTMWRYAVSQGYLRADQNPFLDAKGLIEHDAEPKRDRYPTFGEEMALLAACVGPRAHLREILIVAMDTGLRRNEALTLQVADIEMDRNVIVVRAINAKTGKRREIPMTRRVREVMESLCAGRSAGALIFDGLKEVKRSFATARRTANVLDVRFHDLRHRFVTAAFLAGIPQAVVLKASGHSAESGEWQRYVNVSAEQLTALLEPLAGQSAEEVEAYALERMRELRAALGYERIAKLLAKLDAE